MPCLTDVEVRRPRPGVAVVECKGEHDVTSKDEIGLLLDELVTANEIVVVDVSEATFIDSSFLHNLVKADRLARRRGSLLRLQHNTSLIVTRALEISGLLTVLDSVSSREEAIEPVHRSPGSDRDP